MHLYLFFSLSPTNISLSSLTTSHPSTHSLYQSLFPPPPPFAAWLACITFLQQHHAAYSCSHTNTIGPDFMQITPDNIPRPFTKLALWVGLVHGGHISHWASLHDSVYETQCPLLPMSHCIGWQINHYITLQQVWLSIEGIYQRRSRFLILTKTLRCIVWQSWSFAKF